MDYLIIATKHSLMFICKQQEDKNKIISLAVMLESMVSARATDALFFFFFFVRVSTLP